LNGCGVPPTAGVWHKSLVVRMPRTAVTKLLSLILLAGLPCGACGGHRHEAAPGSEVPAGPLDLEAARAYVLALVNRDRAEHGVPPVEPDPISTIAAQRHANDIAAHGFTAHWGTDGSVPEQRYSEAGGEHMPQENAFCVIDGVARPLEPAPLFFAPELELLQNAFVKQVPPNDSHRRNILKPTHNGFGVGLARPAGVAQPCMVQVFIDAYGSYLPLPREARVGDRVLVGGELADPVEFEGVGVAWLSPAVALPAAELAQLDSPEKRTYRIPDPHVTYFPAGRADAPNGVFLDGRRFAVEVPLDDRGLAGRYEISVWGRHPGNEAPMIVSLRTIDVRTTPAAARPSDDSGSLGTEDAR